MAAGVGGWMVVGCGWWWEGSMRWLVRWLRMLAVVGGGSLGDRHHSGQTVFRRGAAPEKIRKGRTGGSNSLESERLGMALFMGETGK